MNAPYTLDANASPPLIGVVRVGRQRYATNLIWNVVAERRELLLEAEEGADRIDTQLVCLLAPKNAEVAQYGLGDETLNHKAGQLSLAARVQRPDGGSLCAAWPTDDDYWVVIAIREDGAIICDKALATADAARAVFNDYLAHDAWQHTVCPATWGIPGAQSEAALRSFLKGPRARLRSLERKSPVRLALIVGVAVFAVAAVFGWRHLQHMDDASLTQIESFTPPPPPPSPWLDQPRLGAAYATCVQSLRRQWLDASSLPGWRPDSTGVCDGHEVRYTLKSDGGTWMWLDTMRFRLPQAPTLEHADKDAVLAWPLPKVPSWGTDGPQPAEVERVQQYLTAQFAESFTPITLTPGNVSQRPKLELQFSTTRDPNMFLPLLMRLPAAVLDSMAFTASTQQWDIKATVYGALSAAKLPNQN